MQKEKLLEQIKSQVNKCKLCRLHRTRTKPVPGSGSYKSIIAFVGEGPGYNEDLQGQPFVGRAGELLNILLRSIGLRREDVWISNVVKCRPPENRDPMVDEINSCKPYLIAQLGAINPRIIVPLGRFAMTHFIPDGKISNHHGKPFWVSGKIIYPLYHPAAALRSPEVLAKLKMEFRKIPMILKMDPAEMEQLKRSSNDKDQVSMF